MLLRAVADDSASEIGSQRLFIAGYVNPQSTWSLFCDAWTDELRSSPKIDYLKMVEASQLRGQFSGWKPADRDEKMRGFVRVARHFHPLSFSVSVDREPFRRLVHPFAPRGLGNPHFAACFAAVAIVTKYAASRRVKGRVEFIFDQQSGVESDIPLFFEYMTKWLPKSARRLIKGTPVFLDDKEHLPLQAADMLAWHIRREHEDPNNAAVRSIADALRNDHEHVVGHLDEAILQRWGRSFSEIEGANQVRTKARWKAIKKDISVLTAQGYEPPYGSKWRNLLYSLMAWLRRQ